MLKKSLQYFFSHMRRLEKMPLKAMFDPLASLFHWHYQPQITLGIINTCFLLRWWSKLQQQVWLDKLCNNLDLCSALDFLEPKNSKLQTQLVSWAQVLLMHLRSDFLRPLSLSFLLRRVNLCVMNSCVMSKKGRHRQ